MRADELGADPFVDLERDLARPLADLERDGFATLGRVLSDRALELLRERAEDLMLGRVAYPGLFFQHDSATGEYEDLAYGQGYSGPSLKYRKLEKLELDPRFRALVANPVARRVVDAMGEPAGDVGLYRAVLFAKAPEGGTRLPWHQDGGSYWGLDREPLVQLWIALDDVPIESGCLEFVTGSHARGLATPLGGVVPREILAKAGVHNHVEPDDARRANPRVKLVPARAGDAVLIHNYVWHCSGRNATASPRRAVTACYLRGGTLCTRKKRAPRSFSRPFA